MEEVVAALQTHGALIFTGLGGRGLTVEMDDGSERLTVARDTVGATGPFPDCVRNEADVISDAFDRVDKVFSQLMRKQFGADLDVVEEENNATKMWEAFDAKPHLHVYKRSNKMTTAPLALPYHTDNGMYGLLTPSSILPLRTISKTRQVTSWLLPESKLYAAPHGLPALATILSPAPRTVVARMRVAPPRSLPKSAKPDTTTSFWSHFSAPLETETGATLERLLRQRRSAEADNSNCSQDWPHACEHE